MSSGSSLFTTGPRGNSLTRRRRPQLRDAVIGIPAAVILFLLLGHGILPEAGGLALVVQSFLPWLGIAVAVLLLVALVVRAGFGAIPVVAAAVSWSVVFAPVLLAGAATGTAASTDGAAAQVAPVAGAAAGLKMVTQNLRAGNPETAAVAEGLADSGADVVVLQELTGQTLDRIAPILDEAFGYRELTGTVGVWSRFPMGAGEPLTLGLDWPRALRVELEMPDGPVQLYAVHLPSVRPGEVKSRNSGLSELTGIVASDPSARVLVAGDFNAASTDSAFTPLLETLDEARSGFGFTWPAQYPMTRPDHILYRGFTALEATEIDSPGTDHRAAWASLE